jgi:hypothetical protein
MSLTKLSLGGNNDVIYKSPLRESLASDILAGNGNIEKFYYGVKPVSVKWNVNEWNHKDYSDHFSLSFAFLFQG